MIYTTPTRKKKTITWKFGGTVYPTKYPNIVYVRANCDQDKGFVAKRYYIGSKNDKPKEGQKVVVWIKR
jgi:hypothetical protein